MIIAEIINTHNQLQQTITCKRKFDQSYQLVRLYPGWLYLDLFNDMVIDKKTMFLEW